MNRKVKQKKSPFQKAWDEANQLVWITQFEADKLGIDSPPAEEIVLNYFQYREDLENPNDVFHKSLSMELEKLKQEEENV